MRPVAPPHDPEEEQSYQAGAGTSPPPVLTLLRVLERKLLRSIDERSRCQQFANTDQGEEGAEHRYARIGLPAR